MEGALIGHVEHEDRRTIVVLQGEADFSSAPVLSDVLARGIDSGAADVVIDMSRLEFIDTGAVRVLAAGQQRLDRLGRKLTFRSPSSVAARVMEMFGLTVFIEGETETRP
jgi:anti-anti-sigma factor